MYHSCHKRQAVHTYSQRLSGGKKILKELWFGVFCPWKLVDVPFPSRRQIIEERKLDGDSERTLGSEAAVMNQKVKFRGSKWVRLGFEEVLE